MIVFKVWVAARRFSSTHANASSKGLDFFFWHTSETKDFYRWNNGGINMMLWWNKLKKTPPHDQQDLNGHESVSASRPSANLIATRFILGAMGPVGPQNGITWLARQSDASSCFIVRLLCSLRNRQHCLFMITFLIIGVFGRHQDQETFLSGPAVTFINTTLRIRHTTGQVESSLWVSEIFF